MDSYKTDQPSVGLYLNKGTVIMKARDAVVKGTVTC